LKAEQVKLRDEGDRCIYDRALLLILFNGKIDNPRAGKLRPRSSGFLGNLAERKEKKKKKEEKNKKKKKEKKNAHRASFRSGLTNREKESKLVTANN